MMTTMGTIMMMTGTMMGDDQNDDGVYDGADDVMTTTMVLMM